MKKHHVLKPVAIGLMLTGLIGISGVSYAQGSDGTSTSDRALTLSGVHNFNWTVLNAQNQSSGYVVLNSQADLTTMHNQLLSNPANIESLRGLRVGFVVDDQGLDQINGIVEKAPKLNALFFDGVISKGQNTLPQISVESAKALIDAVSSRGDRIALRLGGLNLPVQGIDYLNKAIEGDRNIEVQDIGIFNNAQIPAYTETTLLSRAMYQCLSKNLDLASPASAKLFEAAANLKGPLAVGYYGGLSEEAAGNMAHIFDGKGQHAILLKLPNASSDAIGTLLETAKKSDSDRVGFFVNDTAFSSQNKKLIADLANSNKAFEIGVQNKGAYDHLLMSGLTKVQDEGSSSLAGKDGLVWFQNAKAKLFGGLIQDKWHSKPTMPIVFEGAKKDRLIGPVPNEVASHQAIGDNAQDQSEGLIQSDVDKR